ncbi:hypothetical protein JAAARDRAFT_379604 [Jaapia argillacea MUCL 33604]|uniref:Uncharacterized protein n=1 Tax=Jaapia argillacea MUCL 33604 TaxID=933084 RepID=A0A067Q8W6_9AGAM|nr:hypothetical protein JAAARDRAFT_379604 [Jaapia argillacea MUCL 33604]
MLHHVLRKTVAAPPSLSTILQAAAGRAWTRRVSAYRDPNTEKRGVSACAALGETSRAGRAAAGASESSGCPSPISLPNPIPESSSPLPLEDSRRSVPLVSPNSAPAQTTSARRETACTIRATLIHAPEMPASRKHPPSNQFVSLNDSPPATFAEGSRYPASNNPSPHFSLHATRRSQIHFASAKTTSDEIYLQPSDFILVKDPFPHDALLREVDFNPVDFGRDFPPHPRPSDTKPVPTITYSAGIDMQTDHSPSPRHPRIPSEHTSHSVSLRCEGPFASVVSAGLEPTTPNQFRQGLVSQLYTSPPPSLSDLIRYHDTHASLHSVDSYNILIACAIKHAAFGTARRLLVQMQTEHLMGDMHTWRLWVRLMVRSGKWDEAWGRTLANFGHDLPLDVWLELWGQQKSGALHERKAKTPRLLPYVRFAEVPDKEFLERRYQTLLDHIPNLLMDKSEASRTPIRMISTVVAGLLRIGNRQSALDFTRSFFARLPPHQSFNRRNACLDIVHLHISFGLNCAGGRWKAHQELVRTVLSLIRDFPNLNLRPNSQTLFLLLGTLHGVKDSGRCAEELIQWFKHEWGSSVEDARVRRRLVSLALKSGRPDIVERGLRSQNAADIRGGMWQTQEHVLGRTHTLRKDPEWMLQTGVGLNSVWPERGQERWKWSELRRKVEKSRSRWEEVETCGDLDGDGVVKSAVEWDFQGDDEDSCRSHKRTRSGAKLGWQEGGPESRKVP